MIFVFSLLYTFGTSTRRIHIGDFVRSDVISCEYFTGKTEQCYKVRYSWQYQCFESGLNFLPRSGHHMIMHVLQSRASRVLRRSRDCESPWRRRASRSWLRPRSPESP